MDWASMVMKMYKMWAQRHGYGVTVVDEMPGEIAGIKVHFLSIVCSFAKIMLYERLVFVLRTKFGYKTSKILLKMRKLLGMQLQTLTYQLSCQHAGHCTFGITTFMFLKVNMETWKSNFVREAVYCCSVMFTWAVQCS